MADYDVRSIFEQMELELIASMKRNLSRHQKWEKDEKINWTMWQAEQLRTLENFKKENEKIFTHKFTSVNNEIANFLKEVYEVSGFEQEKAILEQLAKGNKVNYKIEESLSGAFFSLNKDKMNALINATVNDMKKAEHAMLRMVNDQYRKTIFRAHVMANSGAFTLKQSIDAATKDFLKAGINCIEYKDGRRVNIATYAEMAVRTANKRAVLQSEGEARDAYGVHTVRISKYGGCSETCLPWQGRIYVDDIWSGGTKEEANEKNLPLLSEAVESGLFHPNCKHRATTYFYDLEKSLEDQDEEGLENPLEEQEHRKNHLHIQQQERLETGSLDSKNVAEAKQRKDAWIEKDKSLDYGTYLESPLKIDSSDIDSINMYKVNNIVNKKEYHDKFEQLPFSKSTREGLYKESINLLKLRNGTDFESAYAINYRTGEFLVSTSTNEKLMSAFTKYELDIVNECSDGVIIIHNHPLGGRLSMGDLRTLYKQKNCKAMFSIGHNGDIFGCLFNNKLDFKKVDKFYEDVYNMYVNMYGNKTDAEIFALDDVYKSFDLLTINLLERG